VTELQEQLAKTSERASELTFDGEALDFPAPSVFPAPIAHNVVPWAGYLVDDGSLETNEEHKYRNETRKILELPDLPLSCTCVRVPVFTGHGAAIVAAFESEITPDQAMGVLSGAPGVEVVDLPTPLRSAGRDASLVGRIRRAEGFDHALSFFVVGDNLRKGAALNAVQIAEALLEIRF